MRLFNRIPPRATTDWHARSPGKTTFLQFILAQLSSACQVVLLCENMQTYLFYCGKVYSRPTLSGFKHLPTRPIKGYYCPIWTLIDMNYADRGPPIDKGLNIWPVQASPSNRIRWKAWQKQYDAALFGMPLWSMKELIARYVFDLFPLSAINPHYVR